MAVDLFSIGSFTIHGYGLMIAIGFFVALMYASWQCKKKDLDGDFVFNLAMLVLVIGWLGGKILYTIVEFKEFLVNPLNVLASEGFVVYGGVVTGTLTVIFYTKMKKKSFFDYADVIVTGVAINQAFGRVGCFLAGCCYGRETNSWIGVVFPAGSMAPAGVKIIPTQLISAAGDALLFVILFLIINSKKYRKGIPFCVYFSGYAFGRAIVECFRADSRGSVGNLSTSQFIAIFAGALGLLVLSCILRNNAEAVNEDESEDDVKSDATEGEKSDEKKDVADEDSAEDASEDVEKESEEEATETSNDESDEIKESSDEKDEEKK